MDLNIYDLQKIWKEVANDHQIDEKEFDSTKNKIISYLEDKKLEFANWTKSISSLQQLSTNFCQHVNEWFGENLIVTELEYDFKKRVSFILWNKRMTILWEKLSKIESLDYWTPTTIESIWRKKQRQNDVNNKYQEYFDDIEKREILAIYTWIKKQIRTNDGTSIDWESVIKELDKLGYKDIASKFRINV